MAVTLQCPRLSCRAILRLPESTRGHRVRCGECGMAFVVPAAPLSRTVPRPAPQEESEKKGETQAKRSD
jgi:hypothetical protein